MERISFALPTVGTAGMSRQDQIDVLVNQATTAIVCGYLEHMNAVIAAVPPNLNVAQQQVITPAELVALIDSVQAALRNM